MIRDVAEACAIAAMIIGAFGYLFAVLSVIGTF
jgi:hypothetical protein